VSDRDDSRGKREARRNRLREQEARAGFVRKLAAAAVFLLACASAVGLYGVTLFRPVTSRHRTVKVRIQAGYAGAALERAGVIRSALAFDLYARWHGDEGKYRSGTYALSPSFSLPQIMRQLKLGPGHSPDDIIRVSVPEGFTVRQIAARLEKEGVTDGTEFLQLALNPDTRLAWTYDFPRPPGPLEGYLYPDTYEFLPNTPAEKVLDPMLLNFSRRFYRLYQHQIAASGSSLHQIVTIASLIEREAKTQEDRPRIAGVLENRLKKSMKLEIDATVLYALGHHKQRVYYRDLLVDSPYNTYRHAGLPPGPIASPGESSLKAALAPEKNDFYYYVASRSGSHYFTRTLKEHEAAARQARSERMAAGSVEDGAGGKPDEPKNQ
jgi:UPF0755 protein